jgi:hypothetical protein
MKTHGEQPKRAAVGVCVDGRRKMRRERAAADAGRYRN